MGNDKMQPSATVAMHPNLISAASRALRIQQDTLLHDLDSLLSILTASSAEGSTIAGKVRPIRDQISAINLGDELTLEELSSASKILAAFGAEIEALLQDD